MLERDPLKHSRLSENFFLFQHIWAKIFRSQTSRKTLFIRATFLAEKGEDCLFYFSYFSHSILLKPYAQWEQQVTKDR